MFDFKSKLTCITFECDTSNVDKRDVYTSNTNVNLRCYKFGRSSLFKICNFLIFLFIYNTRDIEKKKSNNHQVLVKTVKHIK